MKRFMKSLLLVLLSTMMLAGCAPKLEEKKFQPLEEPKEDVAITVWYAISGASGDAFKALVEKFAAENPKIKIELTFSGSYADTASKVSANLATGTAPDVALMAAGSLYTGGRGDFSMEELIEDPEFNKNDIYEGVWDYAKFGDRIAAIPYGISTQVLYYNKNITDAAGIDMTNPPKTWDELLALAKLAQEKGNTTGSTDFWGLEVSDVPWLFKSMLNQNGNSIVELKDEKVTPIFNNDKAVEVGNFWSEVINSGVMPVGEHSNAEKKFLSGNVAFMIASSNRVQRWTQEPVVNLGAIEMPGFEKQSLALGGNVLVMFAEDGAKRWASWELLKYLADNQTEFAMNTGYLPIRKSGLNEDVTKEQLAKNPLLQVALNQLDHTWAYMHFDEMGTMDGFIAEAVEQIEKGVATPKDALDIAVNNLLREME